LGSFVDQINEAKRAQLQLNKLYKSTINLIDSLKNRSRKYMNQVSNIEDGLLEPDEDFKAMEQNIKALGSDISEFNESIEKQINGFSKEIKALTKMYKDACLSYSGEKGELSAILEARKRLLYLDAVIRKFRHKINSLQQMNNILFSFSEELKRVKKDYKRNLILVNSELAISLEDCAETIRKIELLN